MKILLNGKILPGVVASGRICAQPAKQAYFGDASPFLDPRKKKINFVKFKNISQKFSLII